MPDFLQALSGGGISGQGSNYSKYAISDEKTRQALINAGLNQINAVFGGGTVPVYSPITDQYSYSAYKAAGPNLLSSLYGLNKAGTFTPYSVPNVGGKNIQQAALNAGFSPRADQNFMSPWGVVNFARSIFGGSNQPTPREILNRDIRKGRVYSMANQTYEGFQPDFFTNRENAFVNFALPQYADQYRQARDELFYGLANRGILGSSVQKQQASKLEHVAGRTRQQIYDEARGQSQDLRRAIEQARENAISMLYQSASPALGVQSAVASAGGLRVPSSFAPITNAFSDILGQAALSRELAQNQQFMSTLRGYGEPYYSLASNPVTYGG